MVLYVFTSKTDKINPQCGELGYREKKENILKTAVNTTHFSQCWLYINTKVKNPAADLDPFYL